MISVNALNSVAKWFLFFGIACLPILAGAEYSIPWQNREIIIRGDYLRACAVAYADFSQRLDERKKDSSEYSSHMSRIDNYNVEVSVGSNRYYIWFHPRLSEKFPGIFGGDAEYVIDSKTFELVNKQYGK